MWRDGVDDRDAAANKERVRDEGGRGRERERARECVGSARDADAGRQNRISALITFRATVVVVVVVNI